MKVRLLGSAAGGGLPQWNCGCATCVEARARGVGRTQDGLAVCGPDGSWYLFNASPDLRAQLLAHPDFAPRAGTRESPVRAVVLTSAELDHTLGLLSLREAGALAVYATATVHAAWPLRPVLDAYADVTWRTVTPGEPLALPGGLVATAFAAGAKRPRYAVAGDDGEWTVAYRVTDPTTGGVLVYAPGLAEWTDEFTAGLRGAHLVVLDGTFAHGDELAPRDTRGLGHLPVAESLPRIEANPGPEYVYTHLNNTNVLARPGAGPTARMAAAGVRVAVDGELIVL